MLGGLTLGGTVLIVEVGVRQGCCSAANGPVHTMHDIHTCCTAFLCTDFWMHWYVCAAALGCWR